MKPSAKQIAYIKTLRKKTNLSWYPTTKVGAAKFIRKAEAMLHKNKF